MEELDPHSERRVRLYNPRDDDWAFHFRAQPGGQIVGLTDVGRATVSALRVNEENRVANRLRDRERGTWPG